MSDVATRDTFKPKPIRVAFHDVDGIGSVEFLSLNASDFIKVKSLMQVAGLAAQGDKVAKASAAQLEATVQFLLLTIGNGKGEGVRMFTSADASLIENQDAGVVEQLREIAERHCGLVDLDVEEVGKNSSGTDGESSP